MGTQIAKQDATSVIQHQTNASHILAFVQQISPHIKKDRMQEIVDNAKGHSIEDNQMAVNLLSMALEKSHHLLENPDRVLLLLTKLALSTNTFAQNRIISLERVISDSDQSLSVYKLPGEPRVEVKVVKQGKKDVTVVFDDRLVAWAHLSHPNILPIYGTFLEGEDGPISVVTPHMQSMDIVAHSKTLPQAARMPLIRDVIDGLCYLHSLSIVHGSLNPQHLLISPEGRALITGLDTSSELLSARYSAPEILDGVDPEMASDMWSLGCIIYEVLCGKEPFYQIDNELRIGVRVAKGTLKPLRPTQNGVDVEEIGEAIWGPISTCWETEVKDRPTCLHLRKIFSSMAIHDDWPVPKSIIPPETFENTAVSAFSFHHARSILTRIIGTNLSMASPSQIPVHLQKPLFALFDSEVKVRAVAKAATRLSSNNIQVLVDVLDLICGEAPNVLADDPINLLLRVVMTITYTLPQRYKINRVQYDPDPIAKGRFGRVYKGQALDICVTMVTAPGYVAATLASFSFWAHSKSSIVLPLYGVFHEIKPRLSIVLPYLKHGLLRDYACNLPQKNRLPLISDVINALVYLQGLNLGFTNVRGDRFLITDEGRALICACGPEDMLSLSYAPVSYALRFYAPERAHNGVPTLEACVWSFGCFLYEVLSRKPPYYQYADVDEMLYALSQGETPKRPGATDNDIDEINDKFWDLIRRCCAFEPADRLTLLEIQGFLKDMKIQDDRPEATDLPGPEVCALRSPPDIDWDIVMKLLYQIQVELLRTPLLMLVQNHIKEVAVAVAQLSLEDTRTLVDFLDLALINHITLSDQRNRVLALLSRITASTHIFPRRCELKEVKYHNVPMARGSFGTVHRGVSDPKICVKVMVKVGAEALGNFVKELILWAHISHPNVLPLYGVFVDEAEQICLVSPFMTKGNLRDYGPQLPQKKRIPLLYDVIQGLVYLHVLGIVHTDLKGENVLISEEGRGLITDFGASHIITATAARRATTEPVVSTLRFTAPEIILDPHRRPTQECDIWSFGCLCYEVLSLKPPYFYYTLDVQAYTALCRREPPKRPSTVYNSVGDNEGSDDLEEEPDWDEIDDPSWRLIACCCVPKPEDRPNTSRVQELVVDLKMRDDRPEAKDTPCFYMVSNPDVDFIRTGELLTKLQVRLSAPIILQYATKDVIAAVEELDLEYKDEAALVGFWDLVLTDDQVRSDERSLALALLSALIKLTGHIPWSYTLQKANFNPMSTIGRGSFGAGGSFGAIRVGYNSSLCIKRIDFWRVESDFSAQWLKAVAPSVFSSHPNVLPLYCSTVTDSNIGFLVFPFMRHGNLHNCILRLPGGLQSLILLICDVIEAVAYLHSLGIVHSNLKGENILISDEGRALVADARPYHINVAATEDAPTGPYVTSTLRFTAPELVKNSQMLPTTKSDIWSIGCLLYLVCSRKDPFYQYSQDDEIRSALSQGELPVRPLSEDDGTDEITDTSWDLVTKCCALEPNDRPTLSDTQKQLANLGIHDGRTPAKPLPGAEILKRSQPPGIDPEHVEELLARIKSRLPPDYED